ncbi:MAG: amidohydrolase family protein [Dethiobacteria bacterium]|nr:amidohydrolase family protein [Dethiobacteria bacterium]
MIGSELIAERNLLLHVTGGKIISRQILPAALIPPAVKTHDNFIPLAEDTTLLPSLIDAHTHLALDGEDFKRSRICWDDWQTMLPRLEKAKEQYLQAGIAHIRDGGDLAGINLKAKRYFYNESECGLHIISTGEAVRPKNGYGAFLGKGYSNLKEIEGQVEVLALSGADQVKVVISGVVSFKRYGEVEGPLIPQDELTLVTRCAHHKGLKVMAHASSDAAVKLAIKAGVDSVEHGYFLGRDSLKLMAEKEIAWVPTIIPVAIQIRMPYRKERNAHEIDVITRTYEEQIEKLSYAAELGVPLGVGTDAGALGVRHGVSLVEEMLLFAESALDNRSILQAATVGNAAILGLGKENGSIDKGRRANMIAVQGDPLNDLGALHEIAAHFIPL